MDEKKLAKDKDKVVKPAEKAAPKRYKVLVSFADDKDGNRIYHAGRSEYPRLGYEPSEERVAYLLSDKTSFKRPVIEPIE